MHYGTWRMAYEPIAEPVGKLEVAREVAGLSKEDFDVCALGETRVYEP
jgi:N-acyl-phosphatidylethanolamine-hydrolysing phospholipase D